MVKFLIVLFVIWLLARLAKRWILSKALRMQREMAEQLQAQMRTQMGAGMGAGMGTGADDAASYTQAESARAEAGSAAERMVACAQCGLHIPQSEAVLQAGQTYCSLEHAQTHA